MQNFGHDFLSEQELERAIVKNIEAFLRKVCTSVAFLGSQYRIELEGQEFFIDLLFYHRRLKSLIAVELKVSEFIPEYIGEDAVLSLCFGRYGSPQWGKPIDRDHAMQKQEKERA
jgi:hypothetical protein